MINLLPNSEKRALRMEIVKRMVIIHWFLISLFIICLALILLSMNFYTKGEIDYLKIYNKEQDKAQAEKEFKEFEEKIADFNQTALELKSFYQNKIYISQIIEKASLLLPPSAYLKRIQIVPSEKEAIVSVSGFIQNRESLFEFRKTLQEEKGIKDVVFPSSNWVNAFDIDFSATFNIYEFF